MMDIVDKLREQRDREEASKNGCKAQMAENDAPYPCAYDCPCALRELAINQNDEITRLRAEVERLREALRLIELIGYREGEQAGWMVAHMRGVANDALEGRTSEHIWRLFPHHRAALREDG